MLDGRSRVTVVGTRRRVDVALPSAAPIGEYSAGLAHLCGQEQRGTVPPAWSLAVAGDAPLPLTTSLADSGVVDGQVLYLRNLARDPGGEAVVMDVDEAVAGAADSQRRHGWPRPQLVLALGLLWVAAASGLALRYSTGPLQIATSLVIAGLLLSGTAWALAQQRPAVPAVLCVLASLSTLPCFSVAGALLAGTLAGAGFVWLGGLAGATAAVLMSLAVTPEAVVILLGVPLAVALLVAPLLILMRASRVQTAAAVVVAMLCVLGVAKVASGYVTVWARGQDDDAGMASSATALLVRHRRLLTVVVTVPALALAVALPMLALSGNGFGLAMATVASIGLLVRAQQAGFANELVPLGGAGLAGLFAVVTSATGRLWHNGTAVTAALLAGGLVLVAGATVAVVVRAGGEEPPEVPPGFPSGASRSRRGRRFVDLVGAFCVALSVVLALGVFGVYGDLMGMGRGMVG